ncbi:heme biosynthesis HemY N-terminal domain-containing protein [Aliamphritea ceti]|uniref:heme biosynthesis HemY N-terminal domain-containing protein n=1 Tax=Aliamphritea ceti TaxID=1524258 RepID=UPI0021C39E33|nr:heme biosynthesis HemY N-terminal domain-containing protein [Aliamphritea ceti]
MKKLLILLLILLFAGAWVGQLMIQDSGYTLIAYNNVTIEMSLWVFLIAMFAVFFLFHWALNLLRGSLRSGQRFRLWSQGRNQRIANTKSLKGLIALSEGKWWQAQRLLTQAGDKSELPLISYLAAARAAHEQGEDADCDELLNKARDAAPQAEIAVGISQAQILLSRGQYEPCLATLLDLNKKAPKNTYVMKLLREVYIQLNDWSALSKLIPELRKHNAVKPAKLLKTEQRCYSNILEKSISQLPAHADNEEKAKALGTAWHNMPGQLSSDDVLARHYTNLLVSIGAEEKAEAAIRDLLKRNWDDSLIALYGRIQGSDAKKQLEFAKSFLNDYPMNADLLLTLGRLSLRNQHWGKAVDYFEQSLEEESRPETLSELARLLQHMGETERTLKLIENNFSLIGNGLPQLPMPEKAVAITKPEPIISDDHIHAKPRFKPIS